MKKSELAAFIKEEIKSTLNTEGVWSRGNDIEIQQFIASVDQLKREFYDVVGSDDVFDGLDAAIRAAQELATMNESTEAEIEKTKELTSAIKDLEAAKKEAGIEEDATPKGEDFFYDYLDIGMSYLEGFGKKHSLDDNQLEKLGKKIVDQLYKGDVGKAYDAIVKRGAMNEDEDKEPSDAEIKKNKSLAKAAEELAILTREMKSLAKKYSKAEGQEKEDLLNKLKSKTKLKKELDSILDK
jgi:hypothetical protein